jgi:DNA-binding MarR family transcriptional regulator
VDDELVARLRLVVARLARRLRQQAEGGLSPSTLSALASIERMGPCTLGELAAQERIQPPTVTRIVARLEEDGLVVREADQADRRVARVRLTAVGRQLIHRTRTRKNAYLAKKLRGLSPDELDIVERAVTLLERVLGEDE